FAWAQFIDSSSLFLAPTEVPTAIYDPIDLSPGASRSFSIADVSGATQLLGVHVLPILNENPFNTAGFYTPGDLASINVTNYATFYAFQPNVDYRATTISGNATTLT